MINTDNLASSLQQFAGLNADDFALSEKMWQLRSYKKGDYFNRHKSVCKHLGFVASGVFRSYVIDEKSGEEKNIFFYNTDGFIVTFKSFINQLPCDYHTQALTDATIVYINYVDLMTLYAQSHKWETFGRLLAQTAFNIAMERTESFLFRSPEERYLSLVAQHPDLSNSIPLYHISSYLGIQGPSLSRIRKRISEKK